jgi:tetratricopeptide (TPR) repeat protein
MQEQKPNLKNIFFPEDYARKAKLFGAKTLRVLFGAPVNFSKARDIVKSNYELGVKHLEQGNLTDAIVRLKMVVWLDREHAMGWYQLGRAHLANEQKKAAIDALSRALKLKPDLEEARSLLAIARGEKVPEDAASNA